MVHGTKVRSMGHRLPVAAVRHITALACKMKSRPKRRTLSDDSETMPVLAGGWSVWGATDYSCIVTVGCAVRGGRGVEVQTRGSYFILG